MNNYQLLREITFTRPRPAVFENLGRAYLRMNEPARAEQAFVKAIELNPAQARALLELAEIRFNQKVYMESWGPVSAARRVIASVGSQSLVVCATG